MLYDISYDESYAMLRNEFSNEFYINLSLKILLVVEKVFCDAFNFYSF